MTTNDHDAAGSLTSPAYLNDQGQPIDSHSWAFDAAGRMTSSTSNDGSGTYNSAAASGEPTDNSSISPPQRKSASVRQPQRNFRCTNRFFLTMILTQFSVLPPPAAQLSVVKNCQRALKTSQ